MSQDINANEVDDSLQGLDFPASKEEIVRHVREKEISADTMSFFEMMPPGYYDTPSELREMIEEDEDDVAI